MTDEKIVPDALALIGNTPLVRLKGASEATGCEILAKCEFMNPGGSVKDRAALAIITDAEERGLFQPGGTIVEGTAGNIDTQFYISDEEGLKQVYALLEREGLCVGLSSGINVAGAIALSKEIGPGKTIVTMLCDSGMGYLSSLFNPAWLTARGLPTPAMLQR